MRRKIRCLYKCELKNVVIVSLAKNTLQHPAVKIIKTNHLIGNEDECSTQGLNEFALLEKIKRTVAFNCPGKKYLEISFKREDRLRAPGYHLKKEPQPHCCRMEHEIDKKSYHSLHY